MCLATNFLMIIKIRFNRFQSGVCVLLSLFRVKTLNDEAFSLPNFVAEL